MSESIEKRAADIIRMYLTDRMRQKTINTKFRTTYERVYKIQLRMKVKFELNCKRRVNVKELLEKSSFML